MSRYRETLTILVCSAIFASTICAYTEEEIEMIWSGNLLRVLSEVEKIAEEIQSESE